MTPDYLTLLTRYLDAETTLDEEAQLRRYFCETPADRLPTELKPYRDYFIGLEQLAESRLSDDFDARLMQRLEWTGPDGQFVHDGQYAQPVSESQSCSVDEQATTPVVRARRITLGRRALPLLRAAAVVAVVALLGVLMQHSMEAGGDAGQVAVVADTVVDPHPSAPSVALQQDDGELLAPDGVDRQLQDSLRPF